MRGRHTTERARGHRFLEASGLQRLAKGALSVGLLATALAIAGCASHTLPSSPGNGAPDNDPASLATEEAVSASPAHPVVPSVSLGRPNAGALEVGVEMPEDPRWEIVVPQHAWGTQETVDGIAAAVAAVNREHPGAHPLHIGDLSREFGGPLYPHRSHQSGRDVDLGYYYLPGKAAWYQRASEATLDAPRTWTLIKALILDSDVEYIFVDRSVQRLLRRHAIEAGEDPSWVDMVMQHKSLHPNPIVRHAWGHATHMHVRFYSPEAQARGKKRYEELVARRLVGERRHVSEHHTEPGDDLSGLALRYGTTIGTILQANHIRPDGIEPGMVLKIPRKGRLVPVFALSTPPRPRPPGQATSPRTSYASRDH